MDLKLAGKVALITGSSRGIGLATAKAFVAEGCRIMLSACSAAQLRDTEAALRGAGAAVAAHAGDVGNPADAARLIDATAAVYGGIDVLVNNVGGGGGGARVADSSDDDWRGALERNLIQTVRMMRLALPHMKGRPGAAVINIASISGWIPQLAMSGQYGAAKAALVFRHRALGAGVRAVRHSRQYRLPGFDPGRGQRVGPLPPSQSGVFRGLRPARLSDGPARHRRGGRRCDRVRGVAPRSLDQRPQHSGGRPGAAACPARPPPVLDPPVRVGAALQEVTMPSDPLSRPLIEIARELRDRRASARELVDAAIARHESVGERLHAYSFWAPEQARAIADAADAAFAAGVSAGPLQGLPVSLKDLFAAEGYPCFAGSSRRLPADPWERDGPLVATLRRQLGVIMGKTHMVEFAFGGTGSHHGAPYNPWDVAAHRSVGGSSSGAGVSLLEGSALLAFGSDTAGSVRIPASMTGNAGLKVTIGRWSTGGVVPLSFTFDTPGLLARSVCDLAYGFAALDPAGIDAPALIAQAGRRDLAGIRIGVGDPFLWRDCDPGIAETAQEAVDTLVRAGAVGRDFTLPEAEAAYGVFLEG